MRKLSLFTALFLTSSLALVKVGYAIQQTNLGQMESGSLIALPQVEQRDRNSDNERRGRRRMRRAECVFSNNRDNFNDDDRELILLQQRNRNQDDQKKNNVDRKEPPKKDNITKDPPTQGGSKQEPTKTITDDPQRQTEEKKMRRNDDGSNRRRESEDRRRRESEERRRRGSEERRRRQSEERIRRQSEERRRRGSEERRRNSPGRNLDKEDFSHGKRRNSPQERVRGNIVFIQEGKRDRDTNVRINLSGLTPFMRYGIAVHENGNTRRQCRRVGDIFNPKNRIPPTGALVTLNANRDGEISTVMKDIDLTISGNQMDSILQRSCVIHKPSDRKFESSYSIEYSDRRNDNIVDCARIE